VISGIIVTHGRLGAELLRAAEAIVGENSGVRVFSSGELSPGVLTDQILEALTEAGLDGDSRPIVLFVDLWGGTCFNVCHRILKDYPRVSLVSGVNLPMLLEFLQYREELPLSDLLERIESRGRRGVRGLNRSEAP
jgi:PTS system mannose-specific IIA component